jgi:hypothetical protein
MLIFHTKGATLWIELGLQARESQESCVGSLLSAGFKGHTGLEGVRPSKAGQRSSPARQKTTQAIDSTQDHPQPKETSNAKGFASFPRRGYGFFTSDQLRYELNVQWYAVVKPDGSGFTHHDRRSAGRSFGSVLSGQPDRRVPNANIGNGRLAAQQRHADPD